MGINDSERSQTPQIGVNCFHTIDSAENRDGEIALRTAVYAAGKADDAALRIDAEPAAPEGRLELEAPLPHIHDCRIGCRIIDDGDEIRDAMVSKSPGDAARLDRPGSVAGFAADDDDATDLNRREILNDGTAFDEGGREIDRVRLRKRGKRKNNRSGDQAQKGCAE